MPAMIHLDDVVLEDAARFGLLASPAFDFVREHLDVCAHCRERLAEVDEFAEWMADAPEEETGGFALARYENAQGTVFLVVTGSDSCGWEAWAIGGGYYANRNFARGGDARAWLEREFWSKGAASDSSRSPFMVEQTPDSPKVVQQPGAPANMRLQQLQLVDG